MITFKTFITDVAPSSVSAKITAIQTKLDSVPAVADYDIRNRASNPKGEETKAKEVITVAIKLDLDKVEDADKIPNIITKIQELDLEISEYRAS